MMFMRVASRPNYVTGAITGGRFARGILFLIHLHSLFAGKDDGVAYARVHSESSS